MWGYCVRQEVREGFSEEETLSENCMISRRQIPGREEMGEDREYGVSMMGTHTGRCGRKVIDEDKQRTGSRPTWASHRPWGRVEEGLNIFLRAAQKRLGTEVA